MQDATQAFLLHHLGQARILPILTLDEVDEAFGVIETLLAHGLSVIEITLRTPHSLDIVEAVIKAFPTITVGVGTLLTVDQLKSAQRVGAAFGVSPGITPALAHDATQLNWPYMPGVATASEIMLALAYHLHVVKLFPADILGGVKLLQAWNGPFKGVQYCLTGGIQAEHIPLLLSEKNVLCVGGSWLCPPSLIKARNWAAISQLIVETLSFLK